MAIQTLLPGYNPGAELGTALGQGLGGLLEGLAANKAKQLYQSQTARSLEGLGLSPDQSKALSSLNPQLQQLFVKDILAQPSQQAYAQALGLGGLQQQQPQAAPQLSAMESLQLLQGNITPEIAQKLQQTSETTVPQQPNLARLTERQATELAKIKREEQKEHRKFQHEQQKESNKETKTYYDEISKSSKAAKDSNIRLNRMETLINTGKLQGNFFIKGLESLEKIPVVGPIAGAIEAAFLNPTSQEFKKLSADFVKDAKNFFGSRITQKEVELFLNTVPTLGQSNAGKKRIINNMRIFNQAAILRKDAIDDIIKDHKGRRPSNLDSLVEKKIGNKLDKLSARFTTGSPEAEEKAEAEEPGILSTLYNRLNPMDKHQTPPF